MGQSVYVGLAAAANAADAAGVVNTCIFSNVTVCATRAGAARSMSVQIERTVVARLCMVPSFSCALLLICPIKQNG